MFYIVYAHSRRNKHTIQAWRAYATTWPGVWCMHSPPQVPGSTLGDTWEALQVCLSLPYGCMLRNARLLHVFMRLHVWVFAFAQRIFILLYAKYPFFYTFRNKIIFTTAGYAMGHLLAPRLPIRYFSQARR